MSSKRVLVTGGAGLIGSHLVDLLLHEGHRVRVLDNLEPQTHLHGKPSWIPKDVEFIHGDMRSDADMKRALTGVDWVFHQAAFGGFTTALTKYMDVNGTGTARIFEIIRENRLAIEKVVAASSQAIYGEGLYICQTHGEQYPSLRAKEDLLRGEWEAKCPVCRSEMSPGLTPENAPKNGETIYAISKYAEELLAIGLGRAMGIPTVALRYAVTYGPRQSIYNPYTGVVSIFSTRLLNGLQPVIYEDGLQTRDFLYVKDNARANLFVMKHEATAYQAFNVGTGTPTKIKDLANLLAKIYGKPEISHLPGSFRPGDVRHFVHSSDKLKSLGWAPQVSLAEGLSRYSEWIATQGEIKDYFEDALSKLQAMNVVIGRR